MAQDRLTRMAGRVLAPLAIVLVLVGCLSETPSAGVGDEAGDVEAIRPTLASPKFLDPILLGTGGRGAEPSVVAGPEGRIYVGATPGFWRSMDGGATFDQLGEDACFDELPGGTCMPGRAYKDPGLDAYDGDIDFAVDAQGALYYVGLFGDAGTVPFMRSRDGGDTWTEPFDLANGNDSDRQWIDALPNGTLYVTWRDRGAPDASDPPAHRLFRRSPDGGATWGPPVIMGDDALQGPLAHDPARGALYSAFYEDGVRIARSTDEGATWTTLAVTSEERDLRFRNGYAITKFPVAAVDEAGTVYVVWATDAPVAGPADAKALGLPRSYLAVSHDRGESWSSPIPLSPEGRASIYPWIVAGKPGRVAVAWYENEHGVPNENAPDAWNVVLVESVTADTEAPTFAGGPANAEPIHLGAICTDGGACDRFCPALGECVPTRLCYTFLCVGRDRSMLDFFEVAVRSDGHPVVVWAADPDPADPAMRVFLGGVQSGTPIG